MEIWDVYDDYGNLTGKKIKRGDVMAHNEFHLVVKVFIINNNNEFLISRRSLSINNGGLWECVGGSAITGETSLEASLREVKEEIGISLDTNNAKLFKRYRRVAKMRPDFFDVWVFRQNVDIKDVTLCPLETCDAMYATEEQIKKMIDEKKYYIWTNRNFPDLDKLFEFSKRMVV